MGDKNHFYFYIHKKFIVELEFLDNLFNNY